MLVVNNKNNPQITFFSFIPASPENQDYGGPKAAKN